MVTRRTAGCSRAWARLGRVRRGWRLALEARPLAKGDADGGSGGRPDADHTLLERNAEERRRRGVTFRELAVEYLCWLEDIKGAKPSTLRDHRLLLAEPGSAYRRGAGASRGLVMAVLGDRPAREVTTREVEDLLRSVAATGVAPRTVNKVRQLVCAVFNYGLRPSTYALPTNPATHADRRTEPERAVLAFYSPVTPGAGRE